MEKIVGWALLIGAAVVIFLVAQPKSNAQRYANCVDNANKIYDSARQKITKNVNGYSEAERQYYYDQNDMAYSSDLGNCTELYK